MERSPDKRAFALDALRMPYMISISEGQHMREVELPSLWPMVCTAKKVGAFEVPDLTKKVEIDPLLNMKQQMKHGIPLLEQTSRKNTDEDASECEPPKSTKSKTSTNSKVWENISTTVSQSGTDVPSDCSTSRTRVDCSVDSDWSTTSSRA
jgi:hypothetical protein